MTKKMKEALAVLGPDYTTIFFDGEKCIYRDFRNGHEIEISGMDNNRHTPYCAGIYIWKNRKKIIEQHFRIQTPFAFTALVKALEDKYK